jgi:ubiquinone/menaquinone biosynthesis C-methylase UbiE/uncharacterized protein YbaR (Trm112 family)
MRETALAKMCCPACRGALRWQTFERWGDAEIDHGVVWCVACHSWYPIEGGLLELLPPELAYREDRDRFWHARRAQLQALGLKPAADAAEAGAADAQRKQQEHFDWYASNEVQSYSAYEQMPFWEAVDRKAFRDWRREVRPGGWLLDVGCAQGRSIFNFMDLPLHLVGFDVSKACVREAILRYRGGRCRAEASFFAGDASSLPFAAESFDYVLIYGVLHHLPEPGATAREVARVLKPGGVYFGSENNQTLFRRVFDLMMKLSPLWHEEAGTQPLIGAADLREWFRGTPVRVRTGTQVFVPPHLVNLLGRRWGSLLLGLADRVGGLLPVIRHNGGLIVIRGERGAAPATTPALRRVA